MFKDALSRLIRGQDLDRATMVAAMNIIMSGGATQAQIGAFLAALAVKGETTEEITGAAQVMREKALKIKAPGPCLDTCGTGGDHAMTFNISTAAALIACGAGLTVAKHGNRAASSACGSADVLKQLGVNIEAEPRVAERCLAEINIGFLFAPLLHDAMRYAIGPRREMGVRTIFNILGPLTNPAGAERQLLGVFDDRLTEPLARVLANLGSKAAMVVHGLDGLDEITLTGPSSISELKDGEVRTYEIRPEEFGLKCCKAEDLQGGFPEQNAQILREVLAGKPGPCTDVVALNAGAAIYVAGAAVGIEDGLNKAMESIESGAAREKLVKLIEISNSPARG